MNKAAASTANDSSARGAHDLSDADKRNVLARITQEEVVQVATDLVNIPSPTGSERRVAEYVCAFYERNGIRAVRQEIGRLPAETEWMVERGTFELILRHARSDWAGVVAAYRDLESRTAPVAAAYYAGDALERLGRPDEAARVYERLATHPSAWLQPYRRGQAWLRLGILRQQMGDASGARQAFESLLGLWDHAPRALPEVS